MLEDRIMQAETCSTHVNVIELNKKKIVFYWTEYSVFSDKRKGMALINTGGTFCLAEYSFLTNSSIELKKF